MGADRDTQIDTPASGGRVAEDPILAPLAPGAVPRTPGLPPSAVMSLQPEAADGFVRAPVRPSSLSPQRGAGDRSARAPRRASPMFHLSPAGNAAASLWPSKYVWHQSSLRDLIEDTKTDVSAIITIVDALQDSARNATAHDLERGLDDFEDTWAEGLHQLQDIRRNPAPAPDVAQMDDDVVVQHLTYMGQIQRRIEQVLMGAYGEAARNTVHGVQAPMGGWKFGHEPAALLAGTHALSADERRAVRDASAPAVAVDPVTKKKAAFEKKIAGVPEDYPTRVRAYLEDRITSLHKELVDNKGAADRGGVIAWDRYEDMARAAQRVVDATFGAYARRPAMKHDVNLIDLWESRGKDQAHMTPKQRVGEAAELLRYFVKSDDEIRAINAQHHADPTRAEENGILNGIVSELSKSHTQDLQEINRGWEGEQDPATHRIFMQRWPNDPAGDAQHITQRRAFWDTFEIFMHEYLHSLTNDRYEDMAETLTAEQENTFTEGMTSFMTEVAFANVDPQDPTLRQLIEGPTFATLPFDAQTVPDVSNRRYESYQQARRIVEAVGLPNVYAAYFLGHVDLVRPAK